MRIDVRIATASTSLARFGSLQFPSISLKKWLGVKKWLMLWVAIVWRVYEPFYKNVFMALEHRWGKCIEVIENILKNKYNSTWINGVFFSFTLLIKTAPLKFSNLWKIMFEIQEGLGHPDVVSAPSRNKFSKYLNSHNKMGLSRHTAHLQENWI